MGTPSLPFNEYVVHHCLPFDHMAQSAWHVFGDGFVPVVVVVVAVAVAVAVAVMVAVVVEDRNLLLVVLALVVVALAYVVVVALGSVEKSGAALLKHIEVATFLHMLSSAFPYTISQDVRNSRT